MATNLNKFFVFVSNENTQGFKDSHLGITTDSYARKITFLSGTGEIMTHGQVFALDRGEEIKTLKNFIGTELPTEIDGVSVSSVIDYINKVYTIAVADRVGLDDDTSRISTLESYLGKPKIDEEASTGLFNEVDSIKESINILNSDGITEGSIRNIVDASIADLISEAPDQFNTLKEIADWIQKDVNNNLGFDAAKRIVDLENAVGKENTSLDNESNATGIYKTLDEMKEEILGIESPDGIIDTRLTHLVQSLASSVNLASSTIQDPENVDKNTSVDVIASVTISEKDGKLNQENSSKKTVKADAAGAAKSVYYELLGKSTDSVDSLTLYGVKKYSKKLVDDKNVNAKVNDDETLITASAANNEVVISSSTDLRNAVSKANNSLQSASISIPEESNIYLSVNQASNSSAKNPSWIITPNIGTLTNTTTGSKLLNYNDGLASTKVVADAINDIEMWEEYAGTV